MAGTGEPRREGSGQEPLLVFRTMMRRLRAECPWKREQTHRSLSRYLLEEAHETLEAVDALAAAEDAGDPRRRAAAASHLREELGDLLLQVYFHAAVAEEHGDFDLDDVAAGLAEKMVRRNPHVFGPDPVAHDDATSVDDAWQRIKAEERPRAALLDGVPATLPALLLADKALDRLARAGRPVEDLDPDDLGDRLLGLVAEARAAGADPEQALRDAVRRRT